MSVCQNAPMVKSKFGQIIKEARQKKGWTQSDLARELGYGNPQFVSLLERDQSKVPLRVLGQLIILLDLSEEEVIRDLLATYQAEVMMELNRGKKIVNDNR